MYISKSNIVEVGYTYGQRFLLSDNKFYIGAYHKDKFGNWWTGENHTPSSIRLTEFLAVVPNDPSYITTNLKFKDRFNTKLNNNSYSNEFIQPTEDDYIKGYFTRYIAKNNASSTLTFIEVTKSTYDNMLKDQSPFYSIVALLWKLTGPVNDQFEDNIRIKSGIKDTNLRSIQQAEKTLKDLSLYLTDPLKFARITK